MINVELKAKVEEIIAIEDYFDRAIAISNFEKEYKGTEFFKTTKKSLNDLIKEYRIDKLLSGEDLLKKVQTFINSIDTSNFTSMLDNIAETFGVENKETLDLLERLKDITK